MTSWPGLIGAVEHERNQFVHAVEAADLGAGAVGILRAR